MRSRFEELKDLFRDSPLNHPKGQMVAVLFSSSIPGVGCLTAGIILLNPALILVSCLYGIIFASTMRSMDEWGDL